jgi:hypothetical protein
VQLQLLSASLALAPPVDGVLTAPALALADAIVPAFSAAGFNVSSLTPLYVAASTSSNAISPPATVLELFPAVAITPSATPSATASVSIPALGSASGNAGHSMLAVEVAVPVILGKYMPGFL